VNLLLEINFLSGEITLNNLPPRMEVVYLNDNAFEAALTVGDVSGTLGDLNVGNNKLNGEIVFVGTDRHRFQQQASCPCRCFETSGIKQTSRTYSLVLA